MKIWKIEKKAPLELLNQKDNLSSLLIQLLYNRGFTKISEMEMFLRADLEQEKTLSFGAENETKFYNPFLFNDMEKAVDIIIDHIKKKKKIVVYGDYDADGVTSSAILLETLQILHADVEIYLPDRVSEGYGLNKGAIKTIAQQGFSLIVTVDNGIRNKAEVKYAKELGLEVIITDHHVLPDNREDLPKCPVINPADKEDNYPFNFLAGVGVSFKLINALLYKADLEPNQKKIISEKTLDLVAVGTIADMVTMLGENRILVREGLKVLNKRKRIGLSELIASTSIRDDKDMESWNIGWQIGPRLNAASRLAHANSAFALLTAKDKDEAKELAEELNLKNTRRQKITKEMTAQVEEQINKENLPAIIIGVAKDGQIWNEGVIGLVSGRITEKYYHPSLIITRLVEEVEFNAEEKKMIPKKVSFKGSGRSIEGFNLIEAIEECSDYLDKYGGHPMACGFSIKGEENLKLFTEKLEKIAQEKIYTKVLTPKLKIEAELKANDLNIKTAEDLDILKPFGQNNPQPRFVSYKMRIDEKTTMGAEKQHVKFRLSLKDGINSVSVWAICFGGSKKYQDYNISDTIDVVYYLEINDFNGRRETQLKIIDIKISE
ncbi:MAG: single-stranded-DNA-specific exonuclease RecJ [Patescibacteria group bacterium]|jgi:single-stranded-DNA-specific exonuclease|nr:single-stranded-DNA-specific exonuclease RecJ [Patescibacteria group bacterium]